MATTTVTRVPASFRFQSTLLEELKDKAKASNRSLNNYVESLLINILHPAQEVEDVPNAVTLAAMKEAREGKTTPVDMSSFETFVHSILN